MGQGCRVESCGHLSRVYPQEWSLAGLAGWSSLECDWSGGRTCHYRSGFEHLTAPACDKREWVELAYKWVAKHRGRKRGLTYNADSFDSSPPGTSTGFDETKLLRLSFLVLFSRFRRRASSLASARQGAVFRCSDT